MSVFGVLYFAFGFWFMVERLKTWKKLPVVGCQQSKSNDERAKQENALRGDGAYLRWEGQIPSAKMLDTLQTERSGVGEIE